MSHERSDRLFDQYLAANSKLDYFMLGLAGALTGYLGQHLQLGPLGANSETLELVAVCTLGLSMYFGFRRLELIMLATSKNSEVLYLGESAGNLMAAAQHGVPFLNKATGSVHSPAHAIAGAGERQREAAKADAELDRCNRAATRAYGQRNRCLLIGVATLLLARVIAGYGI